MELVWGTYIAAKAFPTIKRLEFFNVKKFAATALVDDDKAFMTWS